LSEFSIKDAAQRLGVTEVTIRRRIRDGHLHAYQRPRPQGFTWVVELPDEEGQPSSPSGQASDEDEIEELKREDALQGIIKRQDETIEHLRHELEARGWEIQELHVLLQQVQAALSAPRDNHPWWRFWQR
jgi:hypothetical protein